MRRSKATATIGVVAVALACAVLAGSPAAAAVNAAGPSPAVVSPAPVRVLPACAYCWGEPGEAEAPPPALRATIDIMIPL